MLSIKNLSFEYVQADEANLAMCFNLEVNRGEILSVIGPSGSGKTSLLNLIAGFIPASDGEISIDGISITRLDPSQRPLSMVFQSHNLFPHLDVFTNVALGINPSLKLDATQKQAVEKALEDLGLQGLHKRKPGQLSGGQQQRVAIARVLVRQQPLLLLDEAFAALGPALRAEHIAEVLQLVEENNMMALMVSHQPADALKASKRTAFIDNGQVIALQDTERLLNNVEHVEIAQYLGSI